MPRLRLRHAPRAALAALVPLALLGAVAGPAHAAPAAWPEPVPGGAPGGSPTRRQPGGAGRRLGSGGGGPPPWSVAAAPGSSPSEGSASA
ncbi:hypothetical protein ACFU8I_29155, partial [Streptomyces sp. NPDC057540]